MNVLNQTIEQISREKGIDPEIIQQALEDAMVAAAKKYFKTEEDLQARYDPETGTIDVFAVKRIVEEVADDLTEMSLIEALEVDDTFEVDDYVEIPKPTLELGRIAAQTAKQVIFQKVREAEREIIFGEFSEQIGQLVNGIVRRIEGRDIVLDIGRTEAVLPFQRTEPERTVQAGRPDSRRHYQGSPSVQGTPDCGLTQRPQSLDSSLRNGDSRSLRWHCGHKERGERRRRTSQGGSGQQ